MDCPPLLERRPSIAEASARTDQLERAVPRESLPAEEKDALIGFAAGHKRGSGVRRASRRGAPVGSDVLGTLALPTRYDTVLSLLHRGQVYAEQRSGEGSRRPLSCSARCPARAGPPGGSRG